MIVEDAGLDGDLTTTTDNAFFSRSFSVSVNPANDPPTLEALADLTITEDAPQQIVTLTGITAGGGESQNLRVKSMSSNPALIPNPILNYSSPNSTGTLAFTPNTDESGIAVITVIVEDAGLDGDLTTTIDNAFFSRSFSVKVNPANDPPSMDPIDNQYVPKSSLNQKIILTGVSSGPSESQPLRFTLYSDEAFVAYINLTYTDGSETATVEYDLVSDALGSSMITIAIEDGGLDNVLGTRDDNLTSYVSFFVRAYATPVAYQDETTTTINDEVSIAVLSNDSDDDGSLSYDSAYIEIAPINGRIQSISNGIVTYIPNTGFIGVDFFFYSVGDNDGNRSNEAKVEVRVVKSFYQNNRNKFDVDNDSTVSPLDVLILINDLNLKGPRPLRIIDNPPPPYLDVNGDQSVNPLDVLEVIDFINSTRSGEGELNSLIEERDKVSYDQILDLAISHLTYNQSIYFDSEHIMKRFGRMRTK